MRVEGGFSRPFPRVGIVPALVLGVVSEVKELLFGGAIVVDVAGFGKLPPLPYAESVDTACSAGLLLVLSSTLSFSFSFSLVEDENEKGLESLNLDFFSLPGSIGDACPENEFDRLRDGEGCFLTNLRPVPIES